MQMTIEQCLADSLAIFKNKDYSEDGSDRLRKLQRQAEALGASPSDLHRLGNMREAFEVARLAVEIV